MGINTHILWVLIDPVMADSYNKNTSLTWTRTSFCCMRCEAHRLVFALKRGVYRLVFELKRGAHRLVLQLKCRAHMLALELKRETHRPAFELKRDPRA